MNLKLAKRLSLFSHEPGIILPVPFTDKGVQLFPAAYREVVEVSSSEVIPLNLQGPITKWTVCLDLEQGVIKVSGFDSKGFFRYQILPLPDGLAFKKEKGAPPSFIPERLFLGVDKKGEWSRLKEREKLEEFLPYWFQLGQMTPTVLPISSSGSLLCNLKRAIEEKDLPQVKSLFHALFLTGFRGMFFPQSLDASYYGFSLPPLGPEDPPFSLLSEGSRLIRSLFFQEDPSHLFFAPLVTSLFPSGRVAEIRSTVGTIDFIWNRNRLRALRIKALQDGNRMLIFPKQLKTARLKMEGKKKWIKLPLDFLSEKGKEYLFDRFEE
jgi:hypothetical protein